MVTSLKRIGLLILSCLLLFAPHAFAEKFSNSFVEFELLPTWSCALKEATWTCQTSQVSSQADAVLVLAAKRKGEKDTLPNFKDHLAKPQKGQSKVSYVKESSINGQLWIDSLHESSEVTSYFTRYIATVHNDIAVLVTYSIEKSKYAQYQADLDALMRSVKIRDHAPPLAAAPSGAEQGANVKFPGLQAGTKVNPILSDRGDVPVAKIRNESNNGSGDSMSTLLILLVVAGGGFFIYKKKKGQSSSQPPSS